MQSKYHDTSITYNVTGVKMLQSQKSSRPKTSILKDHGYNYAPFVERGHNEVSL